ncbi:SPOSA6832_05086 [Sporobolomyces salmonicolor]|uniref:DNA helicase n=1 Tax=Sporidiobolus salmonicolor TaxID=5005 RepID=A0A0D6ETA9_SPOSA|nr:SPOSA6832_05086 [Sporobolomyces salmonicolor]
MSASTITPQDFLERLIALVDQERSAEEEESSLLLSNAPFNLLQRSGLALGNLEGSTAIGLGGRTLVELTRPAAWHTSASFPPHDFRTGDIARLRAQQTEKGGNKKAPEAKGKGKDKDEGVDAVVYRVSETKIVLAVDAEEEFELPERVQILKLANPATFKRQIHFLRQAIKLLDASAPIPPLLSVLLGLQKPSQDPTFSPDAQPFLDENLNPSQQEAVQFALSSAEVACIWGPPGTGKTQTLVEIIRQLVRMNKRVLVCGASNLSVDNILARLSVPHPNFPSPIPLTRVGHPARVLSSLTRHTLDSQSLATDTSALLEDIKQELQALEGQLRNGSGKNRIRGSERKKKWEEVRELRRDLRKRQGGVVEEVLGKAKVVLATTHGAGGRSLDKYNFDVVIIDEGLPIPSLVSTRSSDGTRLLDPHHARQEADPGDHLQLPPTLKSLDTRSSSTSKKPKKTPSQPTPTPASASDPKPSTPRLIASPTLELTLFSRLLSLYGAPIRRMLKVQYRFNEKINAFPSSKLYDGELVPDESVRGRKLSDLEGVEADEDLDEPVVFFDTAGLAMHERSAEDGSFGSESKSNENEAEFVLALLPQTILEPDGSSINTSKPSSIAANVPATSISLISPYSSQVLLLSSLLHAQYPELEIGSVDSNQGRENDVVIVSLVRSNDEGEVGFLSELRRLNVSMTRPRRHLVVVGDSSTVRQGSTFLDAWIAWLEDEALVRVPS